MMKTLSHWLLLLGGVTLYSCYAEPRLDYTEVCADESPSCLAQDADGDGVVNGEDDFPFDGRCSRLSNEDCGGCGVGCEAPLMCLTMERTCGVGADQGLDQGLDHGVGADQGLDQGLDQLNLNFIRIESGSFMMGSDAGHSDEVPVHSVTVRAFEITATEVTVAQYRACFDAGRCSRPNTHSDTCTWSDSPGGEESHPINCVDWGQARTFAKWVGPEVDLPTEAEWEYAARGGEDFAYAGSNNPDEVAWYNSNSGGSTQPVGTKESNGYGLYDMSGNVWEWVLDEYHSDYIGAPVFSDEAWGSVPECSQVCDTGSARRVNRGGGWYRGADFLRVANRNYNSPDGIINNLGFRLRRTVP